MRVTVPFLVLALVSGAAWAEKVKTNQSTKVFSRAGEQAPVILTLKEGKTVTVLKTEGRWLKVRVAGYTGWIPRSKVDMPEGGDDQIARNTRRRPFVDGRSSKRGFGAGDAPDDRVGGDATGATGVGGGGDDSDDKPAKPDKGDKADKDDDDKPAKKPTKPAKPDKGDKDDDDKPTKSKPSKPDKSDKSDKGDKDDDDKPTKSKPSKSDKGDKADKDDSDDEGSGDDDDSGGKHKGDGDDDGKDSDAKEPERPTAHVSEKTKVLAERDAESDPQFTATPSDVLYPSDQKGKWTFVENDDGDAGWVLTDKLDVEGPGGPRTREIEIGARLGLASLSQSMQSLGSTVTTAPDKYDISTSALTLALGGSYTQPYGKKYVIGAELDYLYETGGISYTPMTGAAVDIGVTQHKLDLHLLGGYDFHKKNGMVLFARLGFRYQAFLVDDYKDPTKNPIQLPQEVLEAPTLGIGLVVPRLTEKIGLGLTIDTILFGSSITQTTGLEDGSSPSASVYDVSAAVTYHWKKDLAIRGVIDVDYASYDFGAPLMSSTRIHMGTDTQRTDMAEVLTVGVAKGF